VAPEADAVGVHPCGVLGRRTSGEPDRTLPAVPRLTPAAAATVSSVTRVATFAMGPVSALPWGPAGVPHQAGRLAHVPLLLHDGWTVLEGGPGRRR
jgi:hypothetical protein